MRRRAFIASLGGAAVWPLVARGQQADRVRRVGALFTLQKDDPFARQQVQAFLQGLQAAGWNVGTDLQVDFRFSGGNDGAEIQAVAKDVVASQPDVIHVATTPGTAAILMETRKIPVVFTIVSDPIGSGFVENFSHPGGNATGFVNIEASMGGKWVQILKEIAPHVSRVTLLFNPATGPQANYYQGPVEAAARALSISSRVAPVGNVAAIEAEIIATAREPDAGLIAFSDIFVFNHRDLIASLANRARLPGRAGGWARLLRRGHSRPGATRSRLHRPHFERGEARRPTCTTADQVRFRHQSQDRQGPWHQRIYRDACHSRRGHRISRQF
jgi:putative tryptophan/tyrosine transport system substrate-binding protein